MSHWLLAVLLSAPSAYAAVPSLPGIPPALHEIDKHMGDSAARIVGLFRSGDSVKGGVPDADIAAIEKLFPPVNDGLRMSSPDAYNAIVTERAMMEDFKKTRAQAIIVQEGCLARAEPDKTIYLGEIELVAKKMGITKQADVQDLARKYQRACGPGEPAETNDAQRLLKAEAISDLLARKPGAATPLIPRIEPQLADKMVGRAHEIAGKLGGLIFVNAQSNQAYVVGRKSGSPVGYTELVDHLAQLPRIQLPAGFATRSTEPPFPMQLLARHAPRLGEEGYEYNWASGSWKFWDDWEKSQDQCVFDQKCTVAGATAKATLATIMKGFYHMSNFGPMVQSYQDERWQFAIGASAGEITKTTGRVALNTGLAALNFVGVGSAFKAVLGLKEAGSSGLRAWPAQKVESIVGEGAAAMSARLAAKVAESTGEVVGAVKNIAGDALKGGGEVTPAQFNEMFDKLVEYAGKEGIEVAPKTKFSVIERTLQIDKAPAVYPEGLNRIEYVAFGKVAAGEKVSPAILHELSHLFHTVTMRSILLKSGIGAADAERYLKLLETGSNYRSLEKLATEIGAPYAKGVLNADRFKGLVQALVDTTGKALEIGKVEAPFHLSWVQLYAYTAGRGLPLLAGSNYLLAPVRMFPPIFFCVYYASNVSISKIPGLQDLKTDQMRRDGYRLPKGDVGFRDLVNALVIKAGEKGIENGAPLVVPALQLAR